jgi:hypothetical protein
MEGINQFWLWKCHNQTPHLAILNKQKCLFSKTEKRKVKQVMSGVDTSGWGEDIRKGCKWVNTEEILCTYV